MLDTGMVKIIAIVDAYAAANQLVGFWRNRGYGCVHIQSTPVIPPRYWHFFYPDNFVANIIHEGNLHTTCAILAKYNPSFCITGKESGVELADSLSETLGLITNGTALSLARRNKFFMGNVLASAHMATIKQQIFTDSQALKLWVNSNLNYPVIVKPTQSAGSDNVRICHSESDLERGFEAIYGHTNKIGINNDQVLVQEYIDGPEYAINSVSYDGKHRFSHIWKYHKKQVNGAPFVYDWEELLAGNGVEETILYEYVADVLDALNIRYGAAHSEVCISNSIPKLIEVGARIDGIANPNHDAKTIGKSQIETLVDFYTDPESRPKNKIEPYRRLQTAYNISLISDQEGEILDIPGFSKIKIMKSYVDCQIKLRISDLLTKTIDLFTSPGMVNLAHEDEMIIRADYDAIREIESHKEFFVMR